MLREISSFIETEDIELDLVDVTLVDSAGIALLIELKQIAISKNINLELINVSVAIKKLLQLYKIEELVL